MNRVRGRIGELFVLGLGIGGGAAAVFALLSAMGVVGVFASHAGDGVVHVCVHRATGQARFIMPGRTPACSSAEVQVDLSDGSPAGNLNYRVSSTETSFSTNFTPKATDAETQCMPGETAISGGSSVVDDADNPIALDYVHIGGGQLFGEPPNGYASAFSWTDPPEPQIVRVLTWVLCVS